MKINLKDGMPRRKGEVTLTVSKNGNLLEIGADGYGEHGAAPGHGTPIVIEHYEGKLTLRVFGDINSEDATHTISLEGARESALRPEFAINTANSPVKGVYVSAEPPAQTVEDMLTKAIGHPPVSVTNAQPQSEDDEVAAFDAA